MCLLIFYDFSFYNLFLKLWVRIALMSLEQDLPNMGQIIGFNWFPYFLFFKWANPGLFYRLVSVFFKQTSLQFLQINVKNVHPVFGARIWTHDLQKMSLLTLPRDQGSPLYISYFLAMLTQDVFLLGTSHLMNRARRPDLDDFQKFLATNFVL